MEKINFTTQDGVQIVGNYFAAVTPSSAGVLCLHMMPETKESWTKLAQLLSTQGMNVLAIDERGHGESIWREAEQLNYQHFSDQEQQAKRLDVDAALTWLQDRKVDLTRCAVIGASIGANLAVDALVRFPQLPAAVLLSPGQDFRGLKTDPAITQLKPKQQVLLVASSDDEYSFESVNRLDQLATTPHDTWRLKQAGHGTRMFAADTGLLIKVSEWVMQRLSTLN